MDIRPFGYHEKESELQAVPGWMPAVALQIKPWIGMMNLNEECLLQFLKNDGIAPTQAPPERQYTEGTLGAALNRVIRRNRYVSFPPAILVRRLVD